MRRLGCLSTGGIVAFIITILLLVVAYAYGGGEMFSPGELHGEGGTDSLGDVRTHAEISKDCGLCHAAPWSQKAMSHRCVDCHAEIMAELKDSQTLHGAILSAYESINCRTCHTDHQGLNALLTYLSDDLISFHAYMGYSLNAHQKAADGEPFQCGDCHDEDVTGFKLSACVACHQEIDALIMQSHMDTFGPECLDCHDGIDTYGAAFNHDAMPFPLVGNHRDLDCSQCHPVMNSLEGLQSTPQQCFACHKQQDVHETNFGQNCGVCHTSFEWDQAAFDHAQTGFPLVGEHNGLECEDCHEGSTYLGASLVCISCHQEEDTHNGQYGQVCSACHTSVDWNEVIFDHALVSGTDCIDCHTKENTKDIPVDHWSVRCSTCHITSAWEAVSVDHSAAGMNRCSACHAYDQPPDHFDDQCSKCHSTTTWEGGTYDHTFPVNHRGARGICETCHLYGYNTYTCYGCHNHNPNKIAKKHKKIDDYSNCVQCHWDGREHDD